MDRCGLKVPIINLQPEFHLGLDRYTVRFMTISEVFYSTFFRTLGGQTCDPFFGANVGLGDGHDDVVPGDAGLSDRQ